MRRVLLMALVALLAAFSVQDRRADATPCETFSGGRTEEIYCKNKVEYANAFFAANDCEMEVQFANNSYNCKTKAIADCNPDSHGCQYWSTGPVTSFDLNWDTSILESCFCPGEQGGTDRIEIRLYLVPFQYQTCDCSEDCYGATYIIKGVCD